MRKLIIETEACERYMSDILKAVACSIENGYICGEGFVIKPFDTEEIPYAFYYK